MDQWLRKPSSKELVEAAIPENLFPGLKRGSPKSDQIIQQTLKFVSFCRNFPSDICKFKPFS